MAEDAPYENLPVLRKEDLPPEWQGEHPVLCVAGRSLLDEAAAIMLGQLSTAHGLAARVETADALSTANIFRLETAGVAIVCLVYMDAASPAHMRYSVRRLRRKLPEATIILGCWLKDMDARRIGDSSGRCQSRPCCGEFGRGDQTVYRGNGRRAPNAVE